MTFTLSSFFGQNMTQVGMLTLKTTGTGFLKRLAAPRTVLIFGIEYIHFALLITTS